MIGLICDSNCLGQLFGGQIMLGKCALSLAIAAVALPAAAWAEPPQVFEASSKITISKSECIQRAKTILDENNFTVKTTSVDPNSDITIGQRDNFTAFIRCDMGDGIAVFVVAGPKQSQTLDYVTAIWKNF